MVLVIKNLPANAGDVRDTSLIPELERSPGAGHGKPLQHSCLENPKEGGAWWAIVHGVTEWTRLKRLSTQAPVAETLNFQCREHKFHPWSGN